MRCLAGSEPTLKLTLAALTRQCIGRTWDDNRAPAAAPQTPSAIARMVAGALPSSRLLTKM
jgi:hypothetical protein